MKRLKYLISFTLSLLIFMAIGFTPADCVPEDGKESCDVPELNSGDEKIDFENCTYKGFPLHGKIKFVDNFPDIKIKIVDNFPDLKVKMVENFPDDCGEWRVVENFPDVKVQIVDNFPDIKVKFVDHFPGKP
ncbi:MULTISPECIES: hypothetical protein [unclassified Lentimicrobium]|uniref:hypothetical protein n=1 Tax=unclassified Lentimicrobium TaxID=2677434 RepID=UPI001C12DE95|nr:MULTISPECIES: hypothetical protein [unclassified Lentimicrobium]